MSAKSRALPEGPSHSLPFLGTLPPNQITIWSYFIGVPTPSSTTGRHSSPSSFSASFRRNSQLAPPVASPLQSLLIFQGLRPVCRLAARMLSKSSQAPTGISMRACTGFGQPLPVRPWLYECLTFCDLVTYSKFCKWLFAQSESMWLTSSSGNQG